MDLINILRRQTQTAQLVMRWLFGLAFVIAFSMASADLAEDVWFREGFSWDAPIILALHRFSNPTLDTIMQFATKTGGKGAIIIAIILTAWFIWKRMPVEAFSVPIAYWGAMIINSQLKSLFERPRPNLFPPLVTESGFSFPSGHVTASVAVYGFLAVILWQNKHHILALLSGAWILMVAISRIYLGAHYPSDAIAAIAFTSVWMVVVFVMQRVVKSIIPSSHRFKVD